MLKLHSVMLLLSLLMIAGCSSQVIRPEKTDTTPTTVKALRDFTVELSPEAELKVADDVDFDMKALTANLQSALEAENLIAPGGDYRLKVVVNDVRVRGTFNAVMWGFLAGDDHLRGDVLVLTLEGEPVDKFSASASYAWGGFGGGQDAPRIDWLYEEFSKVIAEELIQKRRE